MPVQSLPLELLSTICDIAKIDLDDNFTRKWFASLRLVTRAFDAVVVPEVFRVVRFTRSRRSVERMRGFQEGAVSRVGRYMKELVFDGHEVYMDNSGANEEMPDIIALLSQLHKFPELTSLTLELHPNLGNPWKFPEKLSTHLLLQQSVLSALSLNDAAALAKFTTLALHNLIPYHHSAYTSPGFSSLLSRITTLSLSVIHDYDIEKTFFHIGTISFWTDPIIHVLKAATSTTSLTICSYDLLIGVDPPLDWSDLRDCAPALTSFTLENFHFTAQLEDWLVSRKNTLRALRLVDCSMDYDKELHPTRLWGSIWKRFKREMVNLVELDVHCEPDLNPLKDEDWNQDWDQQVLERKMGYTWFHEDGGFREMREVVPGERDDWKWLQKLLALVKTRHAEVAQDITKRKRYSK